MNIGFPDVCLTPAGPAVVPIPYPNLAMNAQAAPFSPVVKVTMVSALNLGSKIPMTSGDEAGSAHPLVKQMGAYTMGNPIVFIDKLPAVHLTCPTTGNGMNNGLGAALVPSATNVFYTLRLLSPALPLDECPPTSRRSWHRDLDLPALGALEQALSRGVTEQTLGEDGIGYVRIAAFSPHVPGQLHALLATYAEAGLRALIVDLAGCPGGDVNASLELLADFLPEGARLALRIDEDGDESTLRSRTRTPHGWPLAVLVDGDTASAAEVLAVGLASHGRAVLVGERTYGKAAAQAVVTDPLGRPHTHTAATFRGPRGEVVDGVGVTPDLVAVGAEARLARAREALRAMLGA
jgi:carboxyl-terminal processing protease